MTQSSTPAQSDLGYAGDITPQTAWEWMQSGEAVLVDVRTDAEREWVGFVPGAVPLAQAQASAQALPATVPVTNPQSER